MKVAIIGAGVGGATAGVALQRAGIEATVFERQQEVKPVGAGATLWTNALLALQRIGLGGTVAAEGVPLERFQHYTARGKQMAEWPIGDIARDLGAPSVGIVRPRLQAAILDALEPGTLRLSAECVGARNDSGRAVATFADGSEEEADLIVGADGLRSRIRDQLPGHPAPVYSGITVCRSVIDFGDSVPPDVARVHYARANHFAFYRVTGGRLHWEAHTRAPEGGTEVSKPKLEELFARHCEPIPGILAATDEGAINRADFYLGRPVESWSSGRIVLLGDAAHPMSSYGGQGACQAIEDGVSLGVQLEAKPGLDAALQAFQAKRIERTAKLLKLNRRLATIVMTRSRILCTVRNAVFPIALGAPAVKAHRRNMEPVL